MTRQDAIKEQHRLCSNATLPAIALDVRAATNGSADPWEPAFMREVVAMLWARFRTWSPAPGRTAFDEMDSAVRKMVEMAIYIGEKWLAANDPELK